MEAYLESRLDGQGWPLLKRWWWHYHTLSVHKYALGQCCLFLFALTCTYFKFDLGVFVHDRFQDFRVFPINVRIHSTYLHTWSRLLYWIPLRLTNSVTSYKNLKLVELSGQIRNSVNVYKKSYVFASFYYWIILIVKCTLH